MEGKRKGGKTGGRKAGTPNKVTKMNKEVWTELVANNAQYVQDVLDELRIDNPKEWMSAFLKMNEFVMPKMSSVSVSADNKKSDVRSELEELMKINKKSEDK